MTQKERLDKLILCADSISRRLCNLPLEIRASWDAFFIDSAVIELRLIIKDIESEMSYAVAEEINNAETINATHVVHGKWADKWCAGLALLCADQLEYCAKCGAKMDERR